MLPARPVTVNVAVAGLTPAGPPVNGTAVYVPAAYPDPPLVMLPAKGYISRLNCASDPRPPINSKVGAVSYLSPPETTVTPSILLVFLLKSI